MKEKKMRMHTVFVGVGCLVIGLLASAFTPRLTAQTTPEPCQAPWDVVAGSARGSAASTSSGWHVVSWNRCTGETFFYSASRHDRTMELRNQNPVE